MSYEESKDAGDVTNDAVVAIDNSLRSNEVRTRRIQERQKQIKELIQKVTPYMKIIEESIDPDFLRVSRADVLKAANCLSVIINSLLHKLGSDVCFLITDFEAVINLPRLKGDRAKAIKAVFHSCDHLFTVIDLLNDKNLDDMDVLQEDINEACAQLRRISQRANQMKFTEDTHGGCFPSLCY
jgi:ribosomal protein L30/L7E